MDRNIHLLSEDHLLMVTGGSGKPPTTSCIAGKPTAGPAGKMVKEVVKFIVKVAASAGV